MQYSQEYIDLACHFSIVRRRLQALIVEAASSYDLTYSEFVLLLRLYDNEGSSQDEMALSLGLDKAVITRVIANLEDEDYIRRKLDKHDRRIKRLYLTKKGKGLEDFINATIQKIVDFLLLDTDDNEKAVIAKCFAKISARLQNAVFDDVFGPREAWEYGLVAAKMSSWTARPAIWFRLMLRRHLLKNWSN